MHKLKLILAIIIITPLYTTINAQIQDQQTVIKSIFEEALTDRSAYNTLRQLCKEAGGRLAASPASYRAIEITKNALIKAGADTVWLQQVPVPNWKRGYEKCVVTSEHKKIRLHIAALGTSTGTGKKGITAGIVEVHDFDELKTLGSTAVKGKIVFFNRPFDNKLINSFAGYSGAVNQRTQGADEASKYGAVAVLVRSATPSIDTFPHTGVTHYNNPDNRIPAVAVATSDAEQLSTMLKKDPSLSVHLVSTCQNYPDTISYNVIGELRGSEKPSEYITVGGHLDGWDITEGAHDDGGGCVQSIEIIRLYKKLGIRPKRTVRAVMFMNEEMSSTGGKKYAEEAAKKGEHHYAALESDRGVMSPRGFSFDTDTARLRKLQSLSTFFQPYLIKDFDKGGSGSDVGALRNQGPLLIGYIPDSQRYFSYHHSAFDTFEQVNIRELQMGSAAIASLIYLIDLFDM